MDGRADLYAAAVLGYEMLCGRPPFYSDDKLEVMSMHTARPVPPMRQRLVRGGRPVPSSIERLIVRGLTKKPSDRYPTADDFLAEVEDALRTPDGGVTDVVFERRRDDTGAQPLVSFDGELQLRDEALLQPASGEATASIADAIDDALNTPMTPLPVAPAPARSSPGMPAMAGRSSPGMPAMATAPPAPAPPMAMMPVRPGRLGALAPSTPKGGVGLGLPYTGPSGEPIFGLTPEQRLAGNPRAFERTASKDDGVAATLEPDPRPPTVIPHVRKRLGLYLVIGACAIAIGVAGAVITSNMTRDTPEAGSGSAPTPPPTPPPGTPASLADEALEHGDVARALQVLDASKDAIASDPQAQLVLGHVRAARNESALALAAYDKALGLAPELETDPRLRAALKAMTASRDTGEVAQALELWLAKTHDPEAKQTLLAAAVADNIARRKAVRPLIGRHGLDNEVDWLAAYSLDLAQDAPCEARRQAVSKLYALGDSRAVPALDRAVVKAKSVTVRGRNHKTTTTYTGPNACLVDDAKAASGYLQGLKKPK
jgi:hypothetical protein